MKLVVSNFKHFSVSLDLSKVNGVQMNFKSDSNGNGRGFSMAYEQIAC